MQFSSPSLVKSGEFATNWQREKKKKQFGETFIFPFRIGDLPSP
jgi:hypothetical protein